MRRQPGPAFNSIKEESLSPIEMAVSRRLPLFLLLGSGFAFAFLFLSCSSARHLLQRHPFGQEQSPDDDVDGICLQCIFEPAANESVDFGRLTVPKPPLKVFRTSNTSDIANLLHAVSSVPKYQSVTVAPNGRKHSTAGQACGNPDGYVLDMRALPRRIVVDRARGYVDADGGAMWLEVLQETLKHGVSPVSWTDYLYLTVGGTLSVAGVSGQTFRHGPQISNVLEMDVVTGNGEMLTCSPGKYSDLFYGVLGGMGQFGVITRARIPVVDAPQKALWVQVPYTEFGLFTRDQELLITTPEPDYVEGDVHPASNHNNNTTTYTLEIAFYYTPGQGEDVQKRVDRAFSHLSTPRGREESKDMTYFDFLNRVKEEEDNLRKMGLWDVPHPWLNVFVPSASIGAFMDVLMETVVEWSVDGPFLVYPFHTDTWDPKASVVLPPSNNGTVYIVGLLRSAPWCPPDSQCVDHLVELNKKVRDAAVGGMGAKLYLAWWSGEHEWSAHFGDKWEGIKLLKARYDPAHVLAPGLKMFDRVQ